MGAHSFRRKALRLIKYIRSGDLNYRIDARRDTVVSAVASGNSESLLQHDQLLKNLATNQSFRLRSFKESAIRFPPTYKYVASELSSGCMC